MDTYTEPDRFGIYIHVPFCVRRCRYCAFYSTVCQEIPAHDYVSALLNEAEIRRGPFAGKRPRSIYLGGGTPSCVPDDEIERLIRGLDKLFGRAEELKLECNPEHVTLARARNWKTCGVTRVSMGVQSFDPEMLRFLGRGHTPDDAKRAFACLRQAGFDEVSIDLIFGGTPEGVDSQKVWDADLQTTKSLAPEHVSCYALTIEPLTPLAKLQNDGVKVCVDDDISAEMMDKIERSLGMHRYEISNYAIPGYFSAHNVACWAGEPYLGLGPGAHSFFRSKKVFVRCAMRAKLSGYMEQALVGLEPPLIFEEHISPEMHLAERLFCAARTRFRWSPAAIARQLGVDVSPYQRVLEKAEKRGLVSIFSENGESVCQTTEIGIKLNNCLDALIFEAAPDEDELPDED